MVPNDRNESTSRFELSRPESTQTVNSTGALIGIFSEDAFSDNFIVETEYLTGVINGLLSDMVMWIRSTTTSNASSESSFPNNAPNPSRNPSA
uniref:Curli production assembly/transport component CsgF n=1 Tax=Panagrellus redivivus TaxID=6233 RepID=A0A7E4VH96_PANRE